MVMLCRHEAIFAQVISNNGAAISVSSSTVVETKDFENNAGSLGNNGSLNMSGNFYNAGSAGGNGFFNLSGNWNDQGSFNAGTSTVTFKGTANQTITHSSSGETFYILTINNPGNIITQVAAAGNTLKILNDLNLTAGSLALGSTTSALNVDGKATIKGSLVFNSITTQTTTIKDILGGTGTIDMSGGNLSHLLNLGGATNNIGTFITNPLSASTVNYNGTDQTVFAANNYRNLTISNSGIKTLQGNSTIGMNLTISGGTFDLGSITSPLSVNGFADIDGSLRFNGLSAKTVSLAGNLSGTGAVDMSGGNRPHLLNLNGAENSIGSYSSGTASTVNYALNGDQTVFTSNDYRNLTVSGSGVKTIHNDITAKGILTMSSGDINSNGNTLKVSNSAITAINRTNGKVIGKLQRAIGFTGSEYLYPIGSFSHYNPLKIKFNALTSGPLTAQFVKGDIGTAGLPLEDDDNEVWDTDSTGYWSLTSVVPMAAGSFDLNLNYEGFLAVDLSSSIIKRTDGGNLQVDGEHGSVTGSEITRKNLTDGIAATTTDFAIGIGRPLILSQPKSVDICEGSDAKFRVLALGRGTLTYRWQVNTGAGFTDVTNGGVYSGATTNELNITGAPYSMNGYLYRCVITDGKGHTNTTSFPYALLTVNKIPVATVTPSGQDECPGVAFIDIVLGTSNDVTGTTFKWVRTNPAGITTSLPLSGSAIGDEITGVFTNTTDNPITVTFTITPTGPATTHCIGSPVTATVTVNPTPKVNVIPAAVTQCDSTTTSIRLTSPSTFTSGLISFKYTVNTSGDVTGFTSSVSDLPNNHYITDQLVNHTDVYQKVTYRVVPVSPAGCADGPYKIVEVTVNPTPRVVPVNIKPEICFGTNTEIMLQSPTVMTSGAIVFDYAVNVTDGTVTGNVAPEINRSLNYKISRQYQNTSDTLKSVYFAITPKVNNNICDPGNIIISEVKVHPKPLQKLAITKPLLCNGGSDAILTAYFAKGSKPDSVSWTGAFGNAGKFITNSNYSNITNLKSGRYDVYVYDELGCWNSNYASISGAVLNSYFWNKNKPANGYGTSCPEPYAEDGEVWVAENPSSTGIAPFTYNIVYNDNDIIIKDTLFSKDILHPDKHYNLHPGNYKLYITDANGCLNDQVPEVNITSPPQVAVEFEKSIFADFNIDCKSNNSGWVKVKSVSGGNGGFRYKWSTVNGYITGVDTLPELEDITAGTYYLAVTDRLGCIYIDSVTLTEPDGLQLVSSSLSVSPDGNTNISCKGGNDGFIDITISGGSGVYTYLWKKQGDDTFTASTEDISGLKAGTYICEVTDKNGCKLKIMPKSESPSFILTEPVSEIIISDSTSKSGFGSYNINCKGGTGSIYPEVTGGSSTGIYTYKWSTSDGSGIVEEGERDQSALTAGTYHLVVKDINGCEEEKDITLTQPDSLMISFSPKHITCGSVNLDNGSIELTVSGGVSPYKYIWSNGATSQNISGLVHGRYEVKVIDANGCQTTDTVTIKLPPELTYESIVSDYNNYNISCYGQSDGSIQIAPTSGTEPFIYSWKGPDFSATTKDISGLKAGEYTFTITDNNYCKKTATFNLKEPGLLGMTFSVSESYSGEFNINCAGDSTGSIGVEPLNQVGRVSYLWSDGFTGSTRINIPAGNYGVVMTDENNCYSSSSVTLKEPDSLKIVFNITEPFCPDKPDGEIRTKVTGGVRGAEYDYLWSNNSSSETISNILRGFYKLTITDMNGCSVSDSVNIEPKNESCLIIPNAISPNGDMINDVWNIGMIELYPEMEIKIFNRWGESLWKSEKGYPVPWNGTSNGSPLPIDSYHYIIDLHNGTKPIVGNVTIVK